MDIQPIVIGTAGHIDHGKSSLVKKLTGVDPDRLKEEQERGLTIDLGYAPLSLPDGRVVGIIDVPGHERFVRNMVAGATGIDLVVLVVAADDGVMPQTREHLSIMQLLGVQRGFVALNKIDLVEPEMVELAAEDVRSAVRGTFLEGAPIVPISAHTGAGLDELQRTLFELAAATPPRSDQGVFRMPIQRVFSARGFGTVITGVPLSGHVEVGDTLEIQPGGLIGKVRGLQAYGESTGRARAGHRTAINLSDVDHHRVARGCVAALPGYFQPVKWVAARLQVLASLPFAVQDRMAIRLHTGTADPAGEIVLLDQQELAAGQSGLVQLRLSEPVVVAPGDPFIVRLASPTFTLGGGQILEESRHRLKRFKGFVIEELERAAESLDSPVDLLHSLLARAEPAMQSEHELAVALKCEEVEARRLLAELRTQGRALDLGGGGRWIHAQRLEALLAKLGECVSGWLAENPHRQVMDVLELKRRSELDPRLFAALLEESARRGAWTLEAGGHLRPKGRAVVLDEATQSAVAAVEGALVAGGFSPPSGAELGAKLGLDEKRLKRALELLADQGAIQRIEKDFFLARAHAERARAEIAANCTRNGHLEIPELRDALGTTRKFLIPLLEWFDAQGLTIRQGANRVLRKR